jgi:glycosyltransferase involved in cell wall biosynthesis
MQGESSMKSIDQSTRAALLTTSSGQPVESGPESIRAGQRALISVIIPTFNRHELLIAAIETILAQTHPPFEIVVVDDGSSDGTGEMLQRFIDQRPDGGVPIRYFFQANQGPAVARNRGVTEARGEWIAFMDSDDPWSPEKLELQVRAMEQFKNDCGACFTDARLWNNLDMDTTAFKLAGNHYEQAAGIVPDIVRSISKSVAPFCWVQTTLIRKDLVSQAGGFDKDVRYGEDYDFLFRLSLLTKFCYVNKVLVSINRTNSNTDPNTVRRVWDELGPHLQGRQCMFEKWLKLSGGLPPDVRKTVVHKLRETHSSWANWYLESGEYEKALQSVSRAMKYEMTPSLAVKWALIRIAPGYARKIAPKSKSLLL